MSTRPEDRIWARAQAGEHTVAIGFHPQNPPPPLSAIRVACDVPQSTLGPIAEAKRKLDIVLGQDSDLMDQARDLFVTGLRRRFLGDVPERGPSTSALVDVCHRIAATGRHYALVFDAVDAADEPTLEMLQRIARRPGGLGLPLVLVFRDPSLAPAAETLVQTWRQVHGDEAVLAPDAGKDSATDAQAEPETFDVRALPADVRQVLRAGAVIGSGFEADLLAELLERSHFDVLDCLQRAADAGVPIDDRGEERFFLPEPVVNALLSSTLPSLQAAWHRQLGWLLTDETAKLPQVAAGEPAHGAAGASADDSFSGTLDELGLGAVASGQLTPPPASDAPATGDAAAVDKTTVLLPAQDADGNDERTVAISLSSVPATSDQDAPESAAPASRAFTSVHENDTKPVLPALSASPPDAPEVEREDDAAATTETPPMRATPDMFAGVFASRPIADEAVPETMAAEADTHALLTGPGVLNAPPASRVSHPTRREIPVIAPPDRSGARTRSGDEGQTVFLPADFDADPAVVTSDQTRMDSGRVRRDPARAAGHLNAAGQIEAAARKYASAAGEASAIGAYEQAMAHGRKALRTIESLPTTPDRRRFRAQLLVALARLQWQAAGLLDGHPDPAFTLDSAMETAELALASIEDDDPDELIAEAREVTAGICYDMGTEHALERALDELTRCARLFLSDGKTLQAARLLNDQAAVYVRLGDPVRATHLLGESQKIFEHRAEDDPLAIRELAETHHLLARLPLHAAIRPGREADAYTMALEHATQAETRYRHLGAIREIARVWEAMGRLHLAGGDIERATEKLEAALQVQSQTGDLTGLARSTGALSDVLAASDRLTDALAVLGDSITLNTEKGSPIGLAFNRRALHHLLARVADKNEPDPTFEHVVAEVRSQLEAAENQLGRVALPPEPGQ